MHRLLFVLAFASAVALFGLPFVSRAQPALTVTVSSGLQVYSIGQPVSITLMATNTTGAPVTVSFPSGQSFDLSAASPSGVAVVWRWAQGRAFTQAFRTQTLAPGEALIFTEQWTQRNAAGLQVPAGVYAISGRLTTQPPLPAEPVLIVIGEPEPLPGPECYSLTLRFPGTTSIDLVAATFEPRDAVRGLWKRDGDRWLGWSPVPGSPNDLRTVNFGDQVRICLAASVRWTRPV